MPAVTRTKAPSTDFLWGYHLPWNRNLKAPLSRRSPWALCMLSLTIFDFAFPTHCWSRINGSQLVFRICTSVDVQNRALQTSFHDQSPQFFTNFYMHATDHRSQFTKFLSFPIPVQIWMALAFFHCQLPSNSLIMVSWLHQDGRPFLWPVVVPVVRPFYEGFCLWQLFSCALGVMRGPQCVFIYVRQ